MEKEQALAMEEMLHGVTSWDKSKINSSMITVLKNCYCKADLPDCLNILVRPNKAEIDVQMKTSTHDYFSASSLSRRPILLLTTILVVDFNYYRKAGHLVAQWCSG